ncbi:hypothetical protein Goshw_027242 [Gossypium schwendimanii]|uniref:Uncharacterized protein n=1 Tax=Gossypium schwendimanii TaxID=34291 RepID=A0A7J9KNQ7_GOSSC|nr:hypothetical protein [Gossypium schwendimanii]
MKRRYQDIDPEDPSPIPIPSTAAPPKVRSPVTLPDSRSNRADGPKTSEFAFFKKLKKDAGQRFDSHSMQRIKNQPHKWNSGECYRAVERTRTVRNISKSSEGTKITINRPFPAGKASSNELGSRLSVEKVNSKDSRSPLPVNNVTLINFDSFPSPVDRAVNNSEVKLKNAFSAVEPIFSIEDWLQHHSDNKKPGGSHADEAELFSRKREKLLQWAHNSFPEIEELGSKGCDVISVLLSRLFPWSNEKNGYRSAEAAPLESNTKAELFACPKSDIPPKKIYRLPERKIMEIQDTPSYLENATPSYWSDISRETVISDIDSTTYNYHSALQKNLELPTCKLREKNLTSCIDNDSTFGFPFVRHGFFLPFISSNEPDDLHDPNGSLPASEPFLPLLERDSLNGTSSYWSDRSRETTLSNIHSPHYNNHSTLQKYLESPSYEVREKNLISRVEGDPTFGFPFVRPQSSLPFSSFKEPDYLRDPTGSLPGRDPCFPQLEWDSVNMNNRSSSATYQNTNWTIVPALQCSWDHQQSLDIPFNSFEKLDDSHDPNGSPGREPHLALLQWHPDVNERSLSATCPDTNWTLIPAVQSSWNHQQSLNNWRESFGTLGLCSSPVLGNYPQYFYTLVSPTSTSYEKHEFGRSILETDEEIIADWQQLPLTLSHSSNCFNLIADCNHFEVACQGSESSGFLPSPENHLGFMSNALVEENNTTDFGNHLSFALNVQWKSYNQVV